MKVVLSRKGFDAKNGGFASPILPDGTLVSLPVPALPGEDQRIRYSDIGYGKNERIIHLLERMGKDKIRVSSGKESRWRYPVKLAAHLDPDLRREAYNDRKSAWKGLFGINGNSQTHIDNNGGLNNGDLFLFFGWFEKYKSTPDNRLVNGENKKEYPTGRHVIFGYLQIGAILPIRSMTKRDVRIKKWMEYHPHIGKNRRFIGSEDFPNNTLYVARKELSFARKPGYGMFRYTSENSRHITLTKKRCTRSKWNLPPIFKHPKRVKISWNPKGWKKDYFQSSDIGQEFVIEKNSNVEKWAKRLVCRFTEA